MRLFSSLPGKHYFISIFVIGAILFTVFSAILYRQYQDVQNFNQSAFRDYESLRMARAIFIDMLDEETGVRGYFISGEEHFLEPYNLALQKLPQDMDFLSRLISGDPNLKPKLENFQRKVTDISALHVRDIKSIGQSGKVAVSEKTLENQKQKMDSLRIAEKAFADGIIERLNEKENDSRNAAKKYFLTLIAGTVLSVGAMFLSTMIILILIGRSRKSQEEVKASEERFLTVMNGINDGLFDFDFNNKTIYYSPAYKAMLGYTQEEHPDTLDSFKSLIHPDDYTETMEHSRRYREREIPQYRNIFRLRHKDGTWHWILSRGIGIWDRQGNLTRLIGTHTDITEQKNSEEDLKQLNLELESFTYIVSHDLRSPLVNLKGFAGEMEHSIEEVLPVIKEAEKHLSAENIELLDRAFKTDIPEALEFINKSVNKMDILTNSVLDLSRIGKREYHLELVDTNKLVQRCVDALAFEINKNNTQIKYRALPSIVSDVFALEQVFSNLLDNAVKYLQPGRAGAIEIASETQGKDIIFSIKDNGRGINEADNSRIFEVFRRARNSGEVRGLGMGMAYVKATLRKLDGEIWFESIFNEGTTFYFRLPQRIH